MASSRARPQAAKTSSTGGSSMPAPGDPNTLYVIDLSGYVFRAYHALPPLSNAKGEPTHAIYGTTQMIKRMIDDRKPAYLAVAMDSRGQSQRKAIDARYKANREAPPPDLASQMARCEEIVRTYGIPIFRQDGLEADDLIATLAARLRKENPALSLVIVSSDKDLMQLVDDRFVLWDTMRDRVYGTPEVAEKFGVPPRDLRDLLALMGDSSDNVAGVPSVGPKTAAELIAKFGSIEAMYAQLHAGTDQGVRPKLRETLLTHENDAKLSQQLVTLMTDAKLDVDLAALRWESPSGDAALALRKLFSELEFTRLVDQMQVRAVITRSHRAIGERAELEAFVADARAHLAADKDARLAITVQASSARTVDGVLLGLGLAFRAGEGVYVPIGHRYLGVPTQLKLEVVREVLGPILGDVRVPKVGHDLKHVCEVLSIADVPFSGIAGDVLLETYLLDPDAPSELREIAQSELQVELPSYDRVTHKDAQRRGSQLPFDEVSIEEATPFVGGSADLARELAERLAPRIDGAGLGKLLHDVELPLTEVLAQMELAGVLVDVDRLRALGGEVDVQLRGFEDEARKALAAAGLSELEVRDFNLGSPKQLEHVLFDVLKLPVLKRTKTSRSTDADVLEELVEKHDLPRIALDHRSLAKLKGTYLDALPKLVSPRTGRIHTTYDQHVAATGRLSSIDPNLQNIPIRTDLGRRIRAAFVAKAGHVLLSADYSQIELRILAHLAEDPTMIASFQRNEDIHAATARELFMDGAAGEPTKEMRRRAKAVNFGVVYGQGENALAKSLDVTREEAGGFIARYFEKYSAVRRYMDAQIEIARKGQGVRTLLGRRRFLNDISSPNRALRLAAERVARNTPIQGTAADVLKLAMVALRAPVVAGARMLLTVHDELVFEVPEARAEEASRIVKATMEQVVKLSVPLVVDVGFGKDWASAK